MKRSRNTQYLASFMIGFGSILNVAPLFTNIANIGTPQDDYNNLKKDWQSVGFYLNKGMEQLHNGRTNTYKNRR